MTQDEIIEMARQAGLDDIDERGIYIYENFDLEAFAKLVAAKEREACSNFVDKILKASGTWPWENADPIRARGEV